MQRSDQIGDLVAALAKAQGEFAPAIKDTLNTAFGETRKYKYADLAANINAVRPALSKHGIALVQFNESDLERQTASVTTSLHFGEQFISQSAEAPAVGRNGFDIQSIGACWTYLRRYTLQALCGLASEDDDGADLAGVKNQPLPPKEKLQKELKDSLKDPAATPPAVTGVRSQFFSKAKECGWGLADIKKFILKAYPDAKGSTANLTEEQLDDALKVMAENKPTDLVQTSEAA